MTSADLSQLHGGEVTPFDDLLQQRWSCRAFLPQTVPDPTMHRMFTIAQRTASWCNTQPWQVHVATGEATRRLSSMLLTSATGGLERPDLPTPPGYSGVYGDRRRAAGFALYESLGIERSDPEGRARQMLRNFEFFDAPHVAIITTDRDLGVYAALDCGGYVANLINAASSLGIATIAQAAIATQADPVREFFDLPEDRLVACAVSFGYADSEHPVNAFRTSRSAVEDAVTFVN